MFLLSTNAESNRKDNVKIHIAHFVKAKNSLVKHRLWRVPVDHTEWGYCVFDTCDCYQYLQVTKQSVVDTGNTWSCTIIAGSVKQKNKTIFFIYDVTRMKEWSFTHKETMITVSLSCHLNFVRSYSSPSLFCMTKNWCSEWSSSGAYFISFF